MENEFVKKNSNLNNVSQNNRVWTGIFLLACGAILLASKMGMHVPGWLMSWEVFVMALGLLIGVRSQFQKPAAFVLLFIGGASFIDNFYPDLKIRNYIWPVFIMLLGLYFILRPHKKRKQKFWETDGSKRLDDEQNDIGVMKDYSTTVDNDEMLDITAVFGGVKKRLISKAFRGGDITAFMGGVEIDLTGTDIPNNALLDITAVFGGIKLLIPADWKVQNKAVVFFGAVEDKRNMPAAFSNKVLIIDGAAVFGGIELKSY